MPSCIILCFTDKHVNEHRLAITGYDNAELLIKLFIFNLITAYIVR